MSRPALVLLVKFKTSLSLEEIREVIDSRIAEFRALDGLTQKYYLRDSMSGELAGLYLWDSPQALAEYQESALRKTIAEAYRAEGTPNIQVFEVVEVLREAER